MADDLDTAQLNKVRWIHCCITLLLLTGLLHANAVLLQTCLFTSPASDLQVINEEYKVGNELPNKH
jgi:hypothetical protein